jgi:hypothetical protein
MEQKLFVLSTLLPENPIFSARKPIHFYHFSATDLAVIKPV